jgi:sigma-E factor negative regulatory protein RseA
MKSQLAELSALLDGELDPHELRPALNAVVGDADLCTVWDSYVLIGDQLRNEPIATPDLTANVMAKLREEPVVLAPRNLLLTRHNHPLLALAASVAGVVVVGWLAWAGNVAPVPAENRLAAVSPAPTFTRSSAPKLAQVPTVAEVNEPASGDMSEYLLAHQTQASAFRLGDNTHSIRTVSMSGSATRP